MLSRDVLKLKKSVQAGNSDPHYLATEIEDIYEKYHTDLEDDSEIIEQNHVSPYIVLSETFI